MCATGDETNFVSYTKCDMHGGLKFLAENVIDKFSHDRGVLVPTGSRASWEITQDQMTGSGMVPFWANAYRQPRDRFVSWFVDHKTHCLNSGKASSVCHTNGEDIHVFNPWLGGDFAPLDRCDYRYSDDKRSNILDTRCASGVCQNDGDSDFSREQYTDAGRGRCWDLDGRVPKSIVVGSGQRDNLCTKQVQRNETCTHPQGTLAGLGKEAWSVYTSFKAIDSLRMSTASTSDDDRINMGGLLVQPRHVVFNGLVHSTSRDGVNGGAIRVSPYDIAGHHIRYIVSADGIAVGDVMLESYKDLEEAERQPGVGTSWFWEFDEVLESSQVTPEIKWTPSWTDWACPLRQQIYAVDFKTGFECTRDHHGLPAQQKAIGRVNPNFFFFHIFLMSFVYQLVIRNSLELDFSKSNRDIQVGVVVLFAAALVSVAMCLFNFGYGVFLFVFANFMPHQILLLLVAYLMYNNAHFDEISDEFRGHYKQAIFSGVYNVATLPFMGLLVCVMNSWITMPMLQFVYTTLMLISVVEMAYNCCYIDANKDKGGNTAKFRMRQAIYLLLVSLLVALTVVTLNYFPHHPDTVHRVVGVVFIGLLWGLHLFFDCTKTSLESYMHAKCFAQYDGFIAVMRYGLLIFAFYVVWGANAQGGV
ncbi:hypothetical protein T484DRAFT_1757763 [Baffinella frigidus]|nr:hypothetical protein T484DRAFT_1757763 [Cryptophyta sp. CCMP2293]